MQRQQMFQAAEILHFSVDSAAPYLLPEIIKYEGKTVIHVHVPPSAEVHTFRRIIYDRVGDSDVQVTATAQIAQMYIRKQEIFTERKIYPYIGKDDLRLDMLPRLRIIAKNNTADGNHPWEGIINPKNPIIASFFRNIGLADQLGSGVRNLFKYSKFYSGKDPEFEEGDVFKITVSLESLGEAHPVSTQSNTRSLTQFETASEGIIRLLKQDPRLSQT